MAITDERDEQEPEPDEQPTVILRTGRCIICGDAVEVDMDALCAGHEALADLVWLGDISDWPATPDGMRVSHVRMMCDPAGRAASVTTWRAWLDVLNNRKFGSSGKQW